MLNSGEKIALYARQKYKYSNSCVVRKQISERNKKPYPLLQVKWSVPYVIVYESLFQTYRAT